jgi:putative oxidoreductase
MTLVALSSAWGDARRAVVLPWSMKWASVFLRISLAISFAGAAVAKLTRLEQSADLLTNLGFPAWTLYVVVLVELACALALLLNVAVDASAGVLILLMLGAVFTHYNQDKSLVGATPAISLLILLSVLIILRRRERSLVSL